MVRARVAPSKKEANENTYTLEEMPDERKKQYESLLEDFDKQVEAHIEEVIANMLKLQTSIRSDYKVETFKLSKQQRDLLQEDLVLKNIQAKKANVPVRESSIFTKQMLAEVAENVESSVTNQVEQMIIQKSSRKRGRGGTTAKKPKAKRSASYSTTQLRRSTRKRIPSERSMLAMNTPFGNGLAKGPLTSTAYSNRTRNMGKTIMQTPSGPAHPFALADVSNVLPAITPKFDIATPFHQQLTLMRIAQPNETVMSVRGSPIDVGQTAQKGRRGQVRPASPPSDLLAVPLGHGRRLMVPTTEEAGEVEENTTPMDLDAEAFAKIRALRKHLDNLLKNSEK